jgi:uncharacterized membrane protein
MIVLRVLLASILFLLCASIMNFIIMIALTHAWPLLLFIGLFITSCWAGNWRV